MESKKRRPFPDAFKREAVDRARTSGLTIIEVAEGLGFHETVLRMNTPVRCAGVGPCAAPHSAGSSPVSSGPGCENARLKREVHKAGMERDILEKAALAIVLEPMAHVARSSERAPDDVWVRR